MVSCSEDNEVKWTFRLLQRYSYENDDSIHLLRGFLGNLSSHKESSRRRSIFSLMNSLGLLVIFNLTVIFIPLSYHLLYYIFKITFALFLSIMISSVIYTPLTSQLR